MKENNGEQMLAVVQQCLENERRQTRTLLVVIGLVMVVILGVAGVFMYSMSKQNARLQEMVLGKVEGGKAETPFSGNSFAGEGKDNGGGVPSSVRELEVVENSTVDIQSDEHSTSNIQHPTSNKDTPPPKPRDPNAIVNLAMPDTYGDPVRIPGYTGEKINLITDRGVVIPWLVVVPE